MRKSWNTIFGLDYERTIWIEQEDLGKEKIIKFNDKQHSIMIPQTIDKSMVVRLRALGRTRGSKTGDLLLEIWLNKGEDRRRNTTAGNTSSIAAEYDDISNHGRAYEQSGRPCVYSRVL